MLYSLQTCCCKFCTDLTTPLNPNLTPQFYDGKRNHVSDVKRLVQNLLQHHKANEGLESTFAS